MELAYKIIQRKTFYIRCRMLYAALKPSWDYYTHEVDEVTVPYFIYMSRRGWGLAGGVGGLGVHSRSKVQLRVSRCEYIIADSIS